MNIQHHFRSLGLEQNATRREAKQAYKKLVKMWHPDRFSDDSSLKETAEEMLKEINVAYEAVKSLLSPEPIVSICEESKPQRYYIGLSKHLKRLWEVGVDLCRSFRQYDVKRFWKKTLRKIAATSRVCPQKYPGHRGFEDTDCGGGKNFEQVMQEVIREKIRSSQHQR